MNVSTITESRWTAREKFLEYKHAVQQRHREEDKAIMEGYRYLSRGKQLINLTETFRKAGMNDNHEPRLAIARATAMHCWFTLTSNRWVFRTSPYAFKRRRESAWARFSYPLSTFTVPPHTLGQYRDRKQLKALVPVIPPSIRPGETQLGKYGILWEADWHHAPKDPILVRFIHPKSPCVVMVAQWDLTELERSVLEGRL